MEKIKFEIDINQWKNDIASIAGKYISGEMRADLDETGSGGFWDLADEIIDTFESDGVKFDDDLRDSIQDDLYMNLKNISKEIVREKIEEVL